MWLVALALRRPYTFVVMAVLIVLLGVTTIRRMGTDIFPEIDIPVIAVIWNYQGMAPDELEKRVTANFERILTTTVNDIEHIESQTLSGSSVIKIFLHPGAKIEAATAQVTAVAQTALRAFPPGMTPPLVMRYSASNVPILQGSMGSDTLSEQQLYDLGFNFLRTGLATVQGAQLSLPFGGKQRLVMVDLDPAKLHAYGLSASDVSDALAAQSLVLPTGTAKFGERELSVRLNSNPDAVAEFNDLPIRAIDGRMIYIRDVAHVRDGYSPQTSLVRVDGRRGVLQPILKAGGSSTLDIVTRVRDALPAILATMPEELKFTLLADQSVFVRAAVSGVAKEAAIAACLTGLMILLFLGSWRSTLIVVLSIPLSIMAAGTIMAWFGQTLNLMTLGGMAMAVGILVDDATVTIENIHRNLHDGVGGRTGLSQAIIDGAQQIAVPTLVSTLCICIVFVPVWFISGVAKSLFTPLALVVVLAMLTSYFLSRTLVPTLVQQLLARELADRRGEARAGFFRRIHLAFERGFAAAQADFAAILTWVLRHRPTVIGAFLFTMLASGALTPFIGRDFFPAVDAGQMRLHVRCPPATRLEETERWFARVENLIRSEIPPAELGTIIDTIGIPISSINLALGDPSMISAADGEIMVTLSEGHRPTAEHVRALRRRMAAEFPELICFFLAADISSQVLNFGISAPIDIKITGPLANQGANARIGRRIRDELARIPGAVDVHLHQVTDAPELRVDVDRTKAEQAGMHQRDVAGSLLISLSSSQQTSPNYWLDANRGVQYSLAVQSPQWRIDSLDALGNQPIAARGHEPQVLSNLASIRRSTSPVNVTHYNVASTIDVLAGVEGTDLGTVSTAVDRIIAKAAAELSRGSTIRVTGQVESMERSFADLSYGLLFAVVLVYLLLVVNFQSWTDPLIILGAVPGALVGILWALFLTHTTFSVPALLGAIMSVGVATANSILVVSFANQQLALGRTALQAAFDAATVRLRPVLMTAAAMVIGMIPMALGLSEGGEQNAPLGRAVIGGLLLATATTLLVVPALASLRRPRPLVDPIPAQGPIP